jgi:hypothetical protein
MSDTTITRRTLARDYKALDRIMEFDHVVYSDGHGVIRDVDSSDSAHWAPEVFEGADGELHLSEHRSSQGWQFGKVYTSAHFIGGSLAWEILDTPGYYVALVVPDDCEHWDSGDWVIAYREAE